MVTLKEITSGNIDPAQAWSYRWTSSLVGRFVRIKTGHHSSDSGWVREADGPFLLIEPFEEAYGTKGRVLVQLPVASIYFGEQPKNEVPFVRVVPDSILSNSPNSDIVELVHDNPGFTLMKNGVQRVVIGEKAAFTAFGGKKFDSSDPVHEGRDL